MSEIIKERREPKQWRESVIEERGMTETIRKTP